MSITGVGAYSNPHLSQMLSSLLTRLDATSTSSTAKTSDDAASGTAIGSATGVNAMLVGPTKPSLSSMILGTLIGLQQQSGDSQDSTNASSSSDSVQSLFSAMVSDASGAVSQNELESYIEQQGGTQKQADTLYSMLASSSKDGITESDLASNAPQGPPPGPPPGMTGLPPMGQDGTSSSGFANDVGSALLKALDTNGDGSVSKSEFESFTTANGGSTTEADTDFSALDTTQSGSLSSSDFATAIEKLQNSASKDTYSSMLTFLDALAQNNTSASSTVSLTA